jgi:hypothetical protein
MVPQKKFAVHGLDDFTYPNLDLNPYAPEVSGAPGLFFVPSNEPAEEWRPLQRSLLGLARASGNM